MKNLRLVVSTTLLLFTLAVAGPLAAAEYLIDASHSTIGFQVRHKAISKTNGNFDDYTGSFNF